MSNKMQIEDLAGRHTPKDWESLYDLLTDCLEVGGTNYKNLTFEHGVLTAIKYCLPVVSHIYHLHVLYEKWIGKGNTWGDL